MEQTIQVYMVNAFATEQGGGNLAGVVLDAESIPRASRQQIAKEVNVSETAFAERGSTETGHNSDFRLEFFTPTREVDNCGHATIATFSLLRQLGQTGEDVITVQSKGGFGEIFFENHLVYMSQASATYEELTEKSRTEVLNSLGLVSAASPPIIVSTGNRFILIGVDSPEALATLVPNFGQIRELSNRYSCIGYYVFALTRNTPIVATSRMFAPSYGIQEEAATGMAAGTLASLLVDRLEVPESTLVLEQGRYMNPPSPSRIEVRFSRGSNGERALLVGGEGIITDVKSIRIEGSQIED